MVEWAYQYKCHNRRVKKMKIIAVILTILLHRLKCLTAEAEFTATGPVTRLIQNLAYNTATINDEISVQLNANIERTSNSVLGNVEVVLANALEQLADPIFEANKQLQAGNCQQTWNMSDLMKRVEQQLSECTKVLTDSLATFRTDAFAIAKTIEASVQDIANLPQACQEPGDAKQLENSFPSHTRCFVLRLADINRNLSTDLNRAGVAFMRVRQLTQQNVSTAQQCAQSVVDEIKQLLEETLQNCL